MDVRQFNTTRGPIPVWGHHDRFSVERPLLLVIRGAFADIDQLYGLPKTLPAVDIAFVHLPGMHSPLLEDLSIPSFAVGLDEVLTSLGHGRVIVLGISIGGAAAMALRAPSVETLLLLDTPLSTAGLWPLEPRIAQSAGRTQIGDHWLDRIFGYRQGRLEGRDYRPLLAGLKVPAHALLASEPLQPERPVSQTPSLVSEADRALYRAHPLVSVEQVEGTGHNLVVDATAVLARRLKTITAPRG